MTFCKAGQSALCSPPDQLLDGLGTYTSKFDAMFVESGPFDNLGLQRVVRFCQQLEGKGLGRSAAEPSVESLDSESILPLESSWEECSELASRITALVLGEYGPVNVPP
jgi:hypothetical protein